MKISKILLHTFLFIIAVGMVFPMFWMLLLSLKDSPERYNGFFELLVSPFSFHNFSDAFSSDSFLTYFLNSFIVVIFVVSGNILFCFMSGYAFARRQFKTKKLLFLTVLGVLIVPSHIVMIPLYRLMVDIDWLNTYFALILPWMITPFSIFLIKQYIESIPEEIEMAARIDGAGLWRIMFKIIFPISKPILTIVAIYTFLTNWNSFLFPFIFTNTESMRTLPVGLAFYLGKQSIDWGHLMAGSAISAMPILILFVIFQKQIIKGLTAGALKE
jgi:ABC-type glycerol-3-phosphate transport system permease component